MTQAIVKGSLAAVAKKSGASLAETFLSADAIILLDCSGSMGQTDAANGQERYEAACAELGKLQAQLPGKICVVGFSSFPAFAPNGKPDFSRGGTDMARALEFIFPANGCGMKIILISDGEPDDDTATLSMARKFTDKIDTVYIGPEDGPGRAFLCRLSEATGGISTNQTTAELGKLGETVQLLLKGA